MSHHIAFIVESFGEDAGGPTASVNHTGRELERLGCTMSYWSPGNASECQQAENNASVQIFPVDWPYGYRYSRALTTALRRGIGDIDLLHLNYLWTYPVYTASRLSYANKKPFIISPRGSLQPWALSNNLFKWLKKKIYLKTVARQMLERCACLHATTRIEAENFRRTGYTREIAIVPNGVDAEVYRPADQVCGDEWPEFGARPVVLFLSRLSPEKGLDLLLPAWAELVREKIIRDELLVLAGPSNQNYAEKMLALVTKLQLTDHVRFTGMVSGEKKIALYRRAEVFVLPSYTENFGLAIAEALACSVPVITTTGTPWNIVKEIRAGWHVSPTVAAIKQALIEYKRTTAAELRAMGQAGRGHMAEHYSWKKVARNLYDIYENILTNGTVPEEFRYKS